jgi:hypothetical protein
MVAIADVVSMTDRMTLDVLVMIFLLSPDEEWESLRSCKYALVGRLKGDPQNGHNQHRDNRQNTLNGARPARHAPIRAAAAPNKAPT